LQYFKNNHISTKKVLLVRVCEDPAGRRTKSDANCACERRQIDDDARIQRLSVTQCVGKDQTTFSVSIVDLKVNMILLVGARF
jgi:hypothetical protein